MISSFRNLTEPVIETPRERRAPDGVGMNVRLDGPGTTDGSGRFGCGGSVALRGEKRLKGCITKIVPNHLAFRKRNRSIENARGSRWLVILFSGRISAPMMRFTAIFDRPEPTFRRPAIKNV
jgi:hypothetical protein